jgi:hypothetical protein
MNSIFKEFESDSSRSLIRYLSIALLISGSILNSLSILVYSKKRMRKMSGYNSNIILSASNILQIVIQSIRYLAISYDQDLLLYSKLSCKLLPFLFKVTSHYFSWINLIIVIERVVNIYSFKGILKCIRSKKISNIAVVFLFFNLTVLTLSNLQHELISQESEINGSMRNITSCSIRNPTFLFLQTALNSLLRYMLPALLMVIFDLVLVHELHKWTNKCQINRMGSSENRLNLSVLCQSIFFLLTQAPVSIMVFVNNSYKNNNEFLKQNEFVSLNYGYFIAVVLSSFYYVFSFFIHLIFYKTFRRQFVKILGNNERILDANQIRRKYSVT